MSIAIVAIILIVIVTIRLIVIVAIILMVIVAILSRVGVGVGDGLNCGGNSQRCKKVDWCYMNIMRD